MDLPALVSDYIEKNSLLSPGEKIVVGVSGGADSCCLLYCLHSLGYELVIGHLDHQLRSESADEAQYVKDIGRKLAVETIIGKEEVRKLSNEGFSLEEAARIARYRFLMGVAQKVGTRKLATGHTADDQIETVLMHFLRGAGTSGLRGMLPLTMLENWSYLDKVEGMSLVRPLLETRRSQTEAYCAKIGIEIIEDASNRDVKFFRNRIRHELIPYLRQFNPRIEDVILRMAMVMKGEASYLEASLDERWANLVTEENHGSIRFNRDKFEEIPLPIKRSFLRRIIKMLTPDSRNLGFLHIEKAIDFLSSERSSGKGQLPSGLEIVLLRDEVAIRKGEVRLHFKQFPQMDTAQKQTLEFPATLLLARGWKLIGERAQMDEFNRTEILSSLDNMKAAIDTHSLCGSLSLRIPSPGDRFQPFGMDGSIKVSDFFINHKIPQPAREFWPLLCDDQGIVWVAGLRISSRVMITPDSTDIFILQVDAPKDECI